MTTEATNQPAIPEQGTPEYDAYLAAQFDAARTPEDPEQTPVVPQGPAQRPESIPEKFWDAEKGEVRMDALLKSYQELERARTQKPEQKQETKPEGKPDEGKPQEGDEAAQAAVKNAGLDWDALGDKILTEGNIGEDDFAALEKAGIPANVAQEYIEGVKAAKELSEIRAFQYAGNGDISKGQEKVAAVLKWAGENLSESEIASYNTMLADPQGWKAALDTLAFKASQGGGLAPNLVTDGVTPAGSTAAFSSEAEMTKAMSDPRYRNDPKYRATVDKRVMASNF